MGLPKKAKVSCIYMNPETEQFWVIDYRIFDPERDGKSKIEHVKDMLHTAYPRYDNLRSRHSWGQRCPTILCC